MLIEFEPRVANSVSPEMREGKHNLLLKYECKSSFAEALCLTSPS